MTNKFIVWLKKNWPLIVLILLIILMIIMASPDFPRLR